MGGNDTTHVAGQAWDPRNAMGVTPPYLSPARGAEELQDRGSTPEGGLRPLDVGTSLH